jgi:hypothetical protein
MDHFADVAHDYHMKRMHKADQPLAPEAFLRKVQEITIDLRKSAADLQARREPKSPEPVEFAGRKVQPGHAHTANGDYALLDEHADQYVAVPEHRASKWGHQDLVRFPKVKEGTHYEVTRRPSVLVQDLKEK